MALAGLPAQLNGTGWDSLGLAGRSIQTTQIYEGTNQIQRMVISKKLGLQGFRTVRWPPGVSDARPAATAPTSTAPGRHQPSIGRSSSRRRTGPNLPGRRPSIGS